MRWSTSTIWLHITAAPHNQKTDFIAKRPAAHATSMADSKIGSFVSGWSVECQNLFWCGRQMHEDICSWKFELWFAHFSFIVAVPFCFVGRSCSWLLFPSRRVPNANCRFILQDAASFCHAAGYWRQNTDIYCYWCVCVRVRAPPTVMQQRWCWLERGQSSTERVNIVK